jgi:uncharacterized RDD family membrane protein YckC
MKNIPEGCIALRHWMGGLEQGRFRRQVADGSGLLLSGIRKKIIMRSTDASEGVYFDRASYAGFLRRLVVDLIDIAVILAVSVCSSLLLMMVVPSSQQQALALFLLWIGLWFLYFVLLKRSDFGTLGYKLCGVRVVNLKGDRPGITALTLRLMFAVFGPLNTVIDLLWLSGDDNGQALRDKFARTYVVRRDAVPAGTGKLVYSVCDVWGWHLVFLEVKGEIHSKGGGTS